MTPEEELAQRQAALQQQLQAQRAQLPFSSSMPDLNIARGQPNLGALFDIMMAQSKATNTTATPTAPQPAASGQSDLGALLDYMKSQKSFDPVAAQTAIRNTPVEDYRAQQQVADAQATRAALNATAAEDAAVNSATAERVVGQEFGGPPPLGTTFNKLLPDQGSTLTAFPSGGYATSRTAKQQNALTAARRAAFGAEGFLKPTLPPLSGTVPYANAAATRPRKRYGY